MTSIFLSTIVGFVFQYVVYSIMFLICKAVKYLKLTPFYYPFKPKIFSHE